MSFLPRISSTFLLLWLHRLLLTFLVSQLLSELSRLGVVDLLFLTLLAFLFKFLLPFSPSVSLVTEDLFSLSWQSSSWQHCSCPSNCSCTARSRPCSSMLAWYRSCSSCSLVCSSLICWQWTAHYPLGPERAAWALPGAHWRGNCPAKAHEGVDNTENTELWNMSL